MKHEEVNTMRCHMCRSTILPNEVVVITIGQEAEVLDAAPMCVLCAVDGGCVYPPDTWDESYVVLVLRRGAPVKEAREAFRSLREDKLLKLKVVYVGSKGDDK